MSLTQTKTGRGFDLFLFADRNGHACNLQASSPASEPAIWLGAADLVIKRCPRDGTGWHNVNLAELFPGQDIVGNERMHLTQSMVRELLPMLQRFAETGELT